MYRLERVEHVDELADALDRLAVPRGRPVLVSIGGAAGMGDDELRKFAPLYASVAGACSRIGATVIDGGTDSGVMKLMGRARAEGAYGFPLVGVVAAGTVRWNDSSPAASAPLEENHTHFVVVPGNDWGDESTWFERVAILAAAGSGVIGLLIGGGDISARDAAHLVDQGWPLLAVGGTGALVDAIAGLSNDPFIERLRATGFVRVVSAESLADDIAGALGR